MTGPAEPDSAELAALTETFRLAGADGPAEWAASQLGEGVPQLARFLFLREVTGLAAARSWRVGGLPNDDGNGGVARRLAESSATNEDLAALVRAAKREVVRDLVHDVLDRGGTDIDPAGGGDPPTFDVHWRLFQTDADGKPLHPLDGLHEEGEMLWADEV